jgi:hypothetical protein
MSRSRLHNDIGRYYNSEKETKPTERMRRYWDRYNDERDYFKPLQNKKKEKQAERDMLDDIEDLYLDTL